MSILLKGWNETKNFFSMYPFPAFLTPFPPIPFTTEEITGCTNDAAKGASKAGRNPTYCFLFHVFFISFYCFSNTIN